MIENDELPDGWANASVASLIAADGLFSDGDWIESKDQDPNGSIRLLQLADIGDGVLIDKSKRFINEEMFGLLRCKEVLEGDVLIARMPDPLGRACLAPKLKQKSITVVDVAILRPGKLSVSPRWLMHSINSPQVRAHIEIESSGTTRKRIARGKLAEMELPIAPLTEQKRIADKLEVVLGRVDACRARLDRVHDHIKRFRQSVIAAATSGKLTEDWREENPAIQTASDLLLRIQDARKRLWRGAYKAPSEINEIFARRPPATWCVASMDSLMLLITSGSRDWSKYYNVDGYAVFVMAQNVRPLRFDSLPVIRVAPPVGDRDKARSEIKKDDLLVTIVGANTGDVCRVPADFPDYYVCQSVALLRPAVPETSRYIEYFLGSEEHGREQFNEFGYGQGRPHLSFDQLRSTAVFLPPLSEQKEIVRRVEALFTMADRIEARLNTARAQVERLTPATLKKAFCGGLVRQDPNDEPASMLLERLNSKSRKRLA